MPVFQDILTLISQPLEFAGRRSADVAPTGKARLWWDKANSLLKLSGNGGAYSEVPTLEADSWTNADLIQAIPDGAFQADAATRALFADAIWPSAKLAETTIQYAEASLTHAMVVALRATPIQLVAAPGAGKVLEFVSAVLLFDYVAAYTETADNMAVRYTNGSGVIVSQAIEATGFVDATADTVTNGLPKIDAIVSKTGSENQALVLHNTGDGEYGGGNSANALRVKVAYRVHTTAF